MVKELNTRLLSASEIKDDKSIDTELPSVVLATAEVITGAELVHGAGTTVTTNPSEAGLGQPLPLVTVTEYVPETETEIDGVVEPSDQR